MRQNTRTTYVRVQPSLMNRHSDTTNSIGLRLKRNIRREKVCNADVDTVSIVVTSVLYGRTHAQQGQPCLIRAIDDKLNRLNSTI